MLWRIVVRAGLAMLVFPGISVGQLDRDIDNDGVWDRGQGGIDRDLDNDGVWDR